MTPLLLFHKVRLKVAGTVRKETCMLFQFHKVVRLKALRCKYRIIFDKKKFFLVSGKISPTLRFYPYN